MNLSISLQSLPRFAQILAQSMVAGDRIYLHGALGAGKTTFVRAVLSALGYSGMVKSPTYTLYDLYEVSGWQIAHFDFFRLHSPEALESIGIAEYLSPPWVSFVEWAEHGGSVIPEPMLLISLSFIDGKNDWRQMTLESFNPRGDSWLLTLQHSL